MNWELHRELAMKPLKPKDLREKNVPELEDMLDAERSALYKARRDLVFRQTTDRASLAVRRHNVARILTVIGEKKRGGETVAPAPKKEAVPKRAAAPKKAAAAKKTGDSK